MAMSRLKAGFIRLSDISLVALALGCGYVGYQWNANEDAAARQKRIQANQSLAQRRKIEERFFQIAKQYDLKVDELKEKRAQLHKLRKDTQTLSDKLGRSVKEVNVEIEKLQKLAKTKEEIASSLRQQRRSLAAEVKELSKLVKIKEDLKSRSMPTCSAPTTADLDELEILFSEVQERKRALEAEIKELMWLVKVKEELGAKSEALGENDISNLGDPMLQKDDPVRS